MKNFWKSLAFEIEIIWEDVRGYVIVGVLIVGVILLMYFLSPPDFILGSIFRGILGIF
jgi:hypothetical protein